MEKTPSRIEEISQQLSQEFCRAVPLRLEKNHRAKKLSEREIQEMSSQSLKKFYDAARAVRAQHKLGLISRARVAFALQQNLLAAGYPAPLVKQVLFAMLTSVFVGGK